MRRQRYCTVLFPRFGALLRWAPAAGPRDLRRTGRYCQEAAQVARAAKSGASAKSASAGISAEAVPRPRAASSAQAADRLFPPCGENALPPLRFLSPQNLRFCGAPQYQSFRMTAPVKNRGFLGGEILRTVRRPKTPGPPPEPSAAGPVGRGHPPAGGRFGAQPPLKRRLLARR